MFAFLAKLARHFRLAGGTVRSWAKSPVEPCPRGPKADHSERQDHKPSEIFAVHKPLLLVMFPARTLGGAATFTRLFSGLYLVALLAAGDVSASLEDVTSRLVPTDACAPWKAEGGEEQRGKSLHGTKSNLSSNKNKREVSNG